MARAPTANASGVPEVEGRQAPVVARPVLHVLDEGLGQLGQAPQFTYGYFSSLCTCEPGQGIGQVIRAAFEGTNAGAVIV